MKRKASCVALFGPLLISGCVNQPTQPLFFGEQVTVGIEIGAGPSSEGVDFILGYKDLDIAIVPVSAINNGQLQEIIASNQEGGGNRFDALSVFGQFEAKAGRTSDGNLTRAANNITLGRFFATGLAATSLAEGYKDGWSDSPQPTKNVSTLAVEQPASANRTPAVSMATARTVQGPQVSTTDLNINETQLQNQAYAPPLVFGQSNTLGLGISTSVAYKGARFTLGYTGRDIALVPVMARNGDGSVKRLGGRNQLGPNGELASNPNQWAESDALSVFGQFKAETETTSVQFGLSRFFTTGMAARNLAEGFKAAISKELKAERLKATASAK